VKLSSPSIEPISEIETGISSFLPPAIVAAEHLDRAAEDSSDGRRPGDRW
jgi:hypothetical protein